MYELGRLMNEQQAIKKLKEVKLIFDNHGVKFWLNYGTLLGAIQQGKFFDWDIDIDISSWHSDIKTIKEIAKTLDYQGYAVTLTNDTLRLDKDGIHIDVYLYRYFEDCGLATKTNIEMPTFLSKVIHYLFLEGASKIYSSARHALKEKIIDIINSFTPKFAYMFGYNLFLKVGGFYYRKAVPAHHFLELSTIKFYNTDFNVPSVTEEYLKYIYGDTWNKQIKDWDVLQGSKQAYSKLHTQCSNCNTSYALDTKKFGKIIKIKCPVCRHKWIDKVFVVWIINSNKYKPLMGK